MEKTKIGNIKSGNARFEKSNKTPFLKVEIAHLPAFIDSK